MMTVKFANMAPRYERVVLCRGLSEKNDSQEIYVKTLKSAGYTCDYLPTLCFEFINTPELRTCLLSPNSYDGSNISNVLVRCSSELCAFQYHPDPPYINVMLIGLVLTSRHAVEAIVLSSKEDDSILLPWSKLPVYCVGPATESFAKTHLGTENCFGRETGNAKELAEKLVANVAKGSKPLLYPCSEISRETIEKTLNENDIRVCKIVAYKTLPIKTLEQDLLKFMDNLPRIFVFFSPSTVEHIVTLLKKKSYDINNIKAVAIGPVTKQALFDAGLDTFATAVKPDPISLLKAISDAEKNEVNENSV